jgi:hypothetical protein
MGRRPRFLPDGFRPLVAPTSEISGPLTAICCYALPNLVANTPTECAIEVDARWTRPPGPQHVELRPAVASSVDGGPQDAQ